MADQAKQARLSAAGSLVHSVLRAAKMFWRPRPLGQHQRVRYSFGANKPLSWSFHCRILKIQDRVLAIAFAGWTQIWRPANAFRAWLWRVDHGAASDVSKFIALKLIGVLQQASKLRFKVAFFLLERRERVVLRYQRILETEYGHPRVSELFEQCFHRLGDLSRIALGYEPFGDGLGASEGCDGQLNLIKHGCPSDSSVRVEEPALSVGAGGPPSAPAAPVPRAD